MTQAAQIPALVRLIDHLRRDPDLLRVAADAARAHGKAGKALPEGEVRRHIVALLDAVAACVAGEPDEMAAAVAVADELAADRAHQGIPLPVLIGGVQAARAVLLQAVIAAGREIMPAEDLLELLSPLDQRVNDLQMSMLLAYRSAEQDLSRTTRTARLEALRELINGGPASWAEEALLDLRRRYHCLVADVSSPRDSRRVETLLDTPEGIAGIVNGYLCRVTPQLPPAHRVAGILVAVSPAVLPAELATAYRWCREALAVHRAEGRRGMCRVTEAALGIALSGQSALGQALSRELLSALDPRDDFHRLLAGTARAYLAHGSKADVTAAALHVHPNTVKYRIRRLAQLTGGFDVATDRPEDALGLSVRWWWALSTWLDTPAGA